MLRRIWRLTCLIILLWNIAAVTSFVVIGNNNNTLVSILVGRITEETLTELSYRLIDINGKTTEFDDFPKTREEDYFSSYDIALTKLTNQYTFIENEMKRLRMTAEKQSKTQQMLIETQTKMFQMLENIQTQSLNIQNVVDTQLKMHQMNNEIQLNKTTQIINMQSNILETLSKNHQTTIDTQHKMQKMIDDQWTQQQSNLTFQNIGVQSKNLQKSTDDQSNMQRKSFGAQTIKTVVNTPSKLDYVFYPAPGGCFTFKVRSANDAHLALTSGSNASDTMLEIFLGHSSNKKTAISKNRTNVAEVSTPGILNACEFRGFWLRWYDNVIKVGREGEAAAFLWWEEPSLFPINYIGIRTMWGATGTWLIAEDQCADPAIGSKPPNGSGPGCWVPAANVVNTPNQMEYILYPAPSGFFTFKVRTAHNAHLALTSGPNKSDPILEIHLGGWSNTKTGILKNRIPAVIAEASTPGILSAYEFRGFWLRWNDNVITVGREGEAAAFLSWKEPSLFPINYVGIRTGWGATGTWLIDKAGAIPLSQLNQELNQE